MRAFVVILVIVLHGSMTYMAYAPTWWYVLDSNNSVIFTQLVLEWGYHLTLWKTGVTLSYDQVSKEKYAPDSQRVEFVLHAIKEGFGKQIVLGGDLARKSYWPSYGIGGGPGLTYILWRFIPWLRSEGLSEEAIQDLLVRNPARVLTIG